MAVILLHNMMGRFHQEQILVGYMMEHHVKSQMKEMKQTLKLQKGWDSNRKESHLKTEGQHIKQHATTLQSVGSQCKLNFQVGNNKSLARATHTHTHKEERGIDTKL